MRRLTGEFRLKCWRVRFMGFAAILVATSAAWLGTPRPTITPLAAQLENVPSHNRLYRASLVPSRDEWTLRLEELDHRAVSGAALSMVAWMPEEPTTHEYRPRVIAGGDGVYRVEGLRLNRSGWWNVKLTIARGDAMTDSLAFNLILP